MRNIFAVALVAGMAMLPACGGGGEPVAISVASADTVVAVNPDVAAAVTNSPFTFTNGVTELGTTSTTTLAFTSSATTPAFSIASGGSTATGTTTFGSCIFVVGVSNFPAGHRLSAGQTITVNPCNIRINTTGQVANGETRSRPVTLVLGTTSSGGQATSVVVTSTGQVLLNGRTVGTVSTSQVSG